MINDEVLEGFQVTKFTNNYLNRIRAAQCMEKLSIIIPAYNEEKTIKQVIERVKAVKLGNIGKEVVVINDASTDNTKKILDSLKEREIKILHHKSNMGKGAAVRNGLEHSTGTIIIIQDADLEYSPEEYAKLLAPILEHRTKIVYGSRINAIRSNLKEMYLLHYFGNMILSIATSVLYGYKVTDMETCYKVFRREVMDGIKLKSKRFDIEPEITAKILKKGYKIIEIPISFKGRKFHEGKKITWKDGIKALYTLWKYRFFD